MEDYLYGNLWFWNEFVFLDKLIQARLRCFFIFYIQWIWIFFQIQQIFAEEALCVRQGTTVVGNQGKCSSCPQRTYCLAGAFRLVTNSCLTRKYMITAKRKIKFLVVQRQMGGIPTEKHGEGCLEREWWYQKLLLLSCTVQDAITYFFTESLEKFCTVAIFHLMFLINKLKCGKVVIFPNQKTQDLPSGPSVSMTLLYESNNMPWS